MTDEKTLIADEYAEDKPDGIRGALPVKECPFCGEIHADEDGYCAECGLYRLGTVHATPEPYALPGGSVAAKLTLPDGTVFELPEGVFNAGRIGADVTIPDAYMSRSHAEIRIEKGKIGITDLGSTNGTFINGNRIAAGELYVLHPGDSLALGKTDVTWEVFHHGEAPAEPEPSEPDSPESDSGIESNSGIEADAASPETEPVETESRPLSGWSLVCTNRQHPPIELWEGAQTLGRSAAKCDRVIEGDSFISGRHAEIETGEDGVYLTDLCSTNGTIVNGSLASPGERTLLLENAAIAIGETEFVVVRTSSS